MWHSSNVTRDVRKKVDDGTLLDMLVAEKARVVQSPSGTWHEWVYENKTPIVLPEAPMPEPERHLSRPGAPP